MNLTTVTQYKEIYANKYGVQFPLSDANVETAIDAVPHGEAYPFKPEVIDLMKSAADAAVGT